MNNYVTVIIHAIGRPPVEVQRAALSLDWPGSEEGLQPLVPFSGVLRIARGDIRDDFLIESVVVNSVIYKVTNIAVREDGSLALILGAHEVIQQR